MRRAMIIGVGLSLALLAGCSAEPGFDEKFEQRSRELNAKAKTIEAESQAQLSQAREAERAEAERSTTAQVASQ